jgi:hypothetical protein
MAGMYWSALSSPRSSMNSPIGLAPLVGVLPPALVLISLTTLAAGGVVGTMSEYLDVGLVGAAVVWVVTLGLLASVGRLLRSERLLSPA